MIFLFHRNRTSWLHYMFEQQLRNSKVKRRDEFKDSKYKIHANELEIEGDENSSRKLATSHSLDLKCKIISLISN